MSQMLHPDDDPLSCKQSDIEALRTNAAWREIVKTIQESKESWTSVLRQAGDMAEVKRAQGTIDALEFVENLPDHFSEELEQLDQYGRTDG